jgi:hypothetical protein
MTTADKRKIEELLNEVIIKDKVNALKSLAMRVDNMRIKYRSYESQLIIKDVIKEIRKEL